MKYIKSIRHQHKLFFVLICILFFTQKVFATHNRAGEITYKNIGGYNYEVTITTYTKIGANADRPELEIFWGDGQSDTIPRTNGGGNGVPVSALIKKNEYVRSHVYPGPADYYIHFKDENRVPNVINIPGSVNIAFYVETKLVILPVSIPNSSPILDYPPIDDGIINQIFIHNPAAHDPDGDSLSYELTPCRMDVNTVIPTYTNPAAPNSFSVNSYTGDLIWDYPTLQGEYNMAMIIREWRTIPGVGLINIGYVTRDLQVTIIASNNIPPQIVNVIDTCVEAGTFIAYTVNAYDTTDNLNDQITLTAIGAPFQFNPDSAEFTSTPATGIVTGNFSWNTTCAHVRKNPYSVIFRAQDDGTPKAVDIETAFITVVGPSPKNPTAVANTNTIMLNWNQSACSEAIGYKIYRHTGYFGFIPSHCETGVPAYTGYSLIHAQIGLTDTTYTDDNNGQGLANGITYCYMITAIYQDGAESYASVEVCTNLSLDLPVITNVDVLTTDNNNGTINIAWSKPRDLDTLQWQGPYRYTLQRATSAGNFSDIISFTDLNDTTYTDSGLNTVDNQYRYKIQFHNETNGTPTLIGTTQIANSVFLTISPGDKRLFLSWNASVPWSNTSYVIYRQNGPVFDSIATTNTPQYIDNGLVNGTAYCYKIKSIGSYGIAGLVNPIINNSEEECQTPIDIEPPCVPDQFSANVNCDLGVDTISWAYTLSTDSCKTNDILSFNLYFIPPGSETPQLIATIDSSQSFYIITDSKNLAGCYFITVTDTNNNTSEPSAQMCTEGCPRYVLPNVFTPNGDGHNDLFHPVDYNYSDVKDIDIKIYNRWGDLLFKTTDPRIDWNGKRNNTGEQVPEGVYFYICIVNEIFLDGIRPRTLTGFIQVIHGSDTIINQQ